MLDWQQSNDALPTVIVQPPPSYFAHENEITLKQESTTTQAGRKMPGCSATKSSSTVLTVSANSREATHAFQTACRNKPKMKAVIKNSARDICSNARSFKVQS
jgi:hypothetical protein